MTEGESQKDFPIRGVVVGGVFLKHPWRVICRREWLPTPVFWPGEFQRQRSLADYSPGVTKSRTQLSDFHFTGGWYRKWTIAAMLEAGRVVSGLRGGCGNREEAISHSPTTQFPGHHQWQAFWYEDVPKHLMRLSWRELFPQQIAGSTVTVEICYLKVT